MSSRAETPRLSFRTAEQPPPSFRAARQPLSFRAAGEESPRLPAPRSLAFARDDKPASFRPRLASSFRAATPPLSFRTARPPLSFRAVGEESPRLAARRSLAFARDDNPASFHPRLASSFRAATHPLSFRTAKPPLSFRAVGEESRRLAAPRSLAFARDDKSASSHPGLASSFRSSKPPLSFRAATLPLSFRAVGEESPRLAARRSLAFARDDNERR